jgi:hypothetical protein
MEVDCRVKISQCTTIILLLLRLEILDCCASPTCATL